MLSREIFVEIIGSGDVGVESSEIGVRELMETHVFHCNETVYMQSPSSRCIVIYQILVE